MLNRIKHSSPAGDLIAMFPGLKQLWVETGEKCIVYQRIGMIGTNNFGVKNAFQNSEGQDISFSHSTFEMMKPLIIAQEYIEDFIEYDGQEFDIDTDEIRMRVFVNQPYGEIRNWVSYLVPQMRSDLSKKYIDAPKPLSSEVILINFTPRYRNHLIDYNFLRDYEKKILFVGLPEEHKIFCEQWKLNLHLLKVDDFLMLAQFINTCKFFLGCQSMCFQIAEGLKIPRILETYCFMPNVIPIGEHAYDFYHQQTLEYYFNKLLCL